MLQRKHYCQGLSGMKYLINKNRKNPLVQTQTRDATWATVDDISQSEKGICWKCSKAIFLSSAFWDFSGVMNFKCTAVILKMG